MYGLTDDIQGLNEDIAKLRKENTTLKNEVASLCSSRRVKGKIIAVNHTADEMTLRMDVGQTSGMYIGDILAGMIALSKELFEKYPRCPKCGMGLIRFNNGPRECVNGQCDYKEPEEKRIES